MNNYAFVKSLFKDDVKKVRDIRLGKCSVEIWQEANAMPPQKVALVIDADRNVIQSRLDDGELIKAIDSLKLSVEDIELFLEIFKDLSPHRRTIINQIRYPYQERISDIWHEPKMIGNDLVFYADNESGGFLEKVYVRDLCRAEIEIVAKTSGILLK
ncbi:MAG: hypothetical protein AB2672_14990 [Candidatus Thiodiazotropha endolucinida]